MTKFPFSKKAINLMLASALVATPLATLAPVTGGVSVEASSVTSETSALDTVNSLIAIYDGLTPEEKAQVKDQQAKLANVDWVTILGQDLITVIDAKLHDGRTVEIAQQITSVLLETDKHQLYVDLLALYSDEQLKADFKTVFGEDVTLVDLLGFSSDLEAYMSTYYTQESFTATLNDTYNGSLSDFMIDEAMYYVYVERYEDYVQVSSALKQGTDGVLTFDYLFGMLDRTFVELFANDDADYTNLITSLRASALDVILSQLDAEPTPVPVPTPMPEPTTVEKVTNPDGSSTVVVTVDTNKLTEMLKYQTSVEKVTFTNVNAAGEAAEVKIPSSAFAVVKEKNPNAKVEVTSNEGTLRLPVSEINFADIANNLGVAEQDVTISVKVNLVTGTQEAVTKNNLTVKSNVVEFKIEATAGDKKVAIDRFNQYLEREIVGSADFDAAKSTVVRLNEDGTFTAVPTIIEGSKATFKNFSNSKYTVVENVATFSDVVDGYWAKGTIEKLGSKYIVLGKPNGEFAPLKATTRAEFAALLTRSLGLATNGEYDNRFSDVTGTEWFVKDLVAAVEYGIIKGHANGTFGSDQAVTREEAAVMIARALELVKFDTSGLADADISTFEDAAEVSPWAKDAVETLLQLEVTEGRPSGFAPKDGTKRAEAATLLERFLVKINFMN